MPRITVNLPTDVHQSLKATALANKRSLHSEILRRLTKPPQQPTFNDLKQGAYYAANL